MPPDVMAKANTRVPPATDRSTTVPGDNWSVLVLDASPSWCGTTFPEFWRYRELLYFLVWRDLKVRYKQTILGAVWAIIQPLMSMIIFTILFGKGAGLETRTGDVPYALYVYAGLLPWTFFANAITAAGTSLVTNRSLITKVYFPRLMIPISTVGAGLVDSAIAFLVLVAMMVWYGVSPGMGVLLLPFVTLFLSFAAVGVGSLLSGLTVVYRDFRYIAGFMTQMWMFVTPIIYPASMVPERWRWVLTLNPMSGLIDAFRYSLLGYPSEGVATGLAISCILTLVTLALGVIYFSREEETFADVI
jgi:lipopolysaccharide transport system permease protein